jgi:hypothetical protein
MVKVKLDPEAVENIFKTAKSQDACLIEMYKLAFSNWENIAKVEGWPQCNRNTWKKIARLCQDFDTVLNKSRPIYNEMMPGGGWLNSGFSCHDAPADLGDWEIILCGVTLKQK